MIDCAFEFSGFSLSLSLSPSLSVSRDIYIYIYCNLRIVFAPVEKRDEA